MLAKKEKIKILKLQNSIAIKTLHIFTDDWEPYIINKHSRWSMILERQICFIWLSKSNVVSYGVENMALVYNMHACYL